MLGFVQTLLDDLIQLVSNQSGDIVAYLLTRAQVTLSWYTPYTINGAIANARMVWWQERKLRHKKCVDGAAAKGKNRLDRYVRCRGNGADVREQMMQ